MPPRQTGLALCRRGSFDEPVIIYIKFKQRLKLLYTDKFYTYILFSRKDNKLYIGFTNNLKKRLREHACGEVSSTKNRRPLKLIHYEYFINKDDAEAREKFLKSGYGHEQLQNILKRTLAF